MPTEPLLCKNVEFIYFLLCLSLFDLLFTLDRLTKHRKLYFFIYFIYRKQWDVYQYVIQ